MDRFNEIIRETIDNYLLQESYSISNEVIEATNQCLSKIENAYKNKEYELDSIKISAEPNTPIPLARIILDVPINNIETFNSLNKMVISIYDFADVNKMMEMANVIGIGGETNMHNNSINIVCSSINGKLRLNQLKPILSHELEHYFQNTLGGIRKDYKSWYDISNQYMQNGDDGSIEYLVARLIYYFNQQEIDASMHELMHDLISLKIENPNDIYKCNVIMEKNHYINFIYKKLMSCDQNELNNILEKIYKTNKKTFFAYLSKQIHYFEKKTMRVVMEYFRRKQIVYKPKPLTPSR